MIFWKYMFSALFPAPLTPQEPFRLRQPIFTKQLPQLFHYLLIVDNIII